MLFERLAMAGDCQAFLHSGVLVDYGESEQQLQQQQAPEVHLPPLVSSVSAAEQLHALDTAGNLTFTGCQMVPVMCSALLVSPVVGRSPHAHLKIVLDSPGISMPASMPLLCPPSSSTSSLLTLCVVHFFLLLLRYDATMLATPQAFVRDPSLVWEFYHWRREVVSRCRCV
jgi:hypothetical protein